MTSQAGLVDLKRKDTTGRQSSPASTSRPLLLLPLAFRRRPHVRQQPPGTWRRDLTPRRPSAATAPAGLVEAEALEQRLEQRLAEAGAVAALLQAMPSTERWPPRRRLPAPRPWASDSPRQDALHRVVAAMQRNTAGGTVEAGRQLRGPGLGDVGLAIAGGVVERRTMRDASSVVSRHVGHLPPSMRRWTLEREEGCSAQGAWEREEGCSAQSASAVA